MMELRWLTYDEDEVVLPPAELIQYGRRYEPTRVTKKKLQYRQKYNATIYAGMPSEEFKNQTAQMVWSKWTDVPTVVGDDLSCP